MLLEPILSELVAVDLASRGFIDAPDNLARLCGASWAAGLDRDPLLYNTLCSRYNRFAVSRLWGWLHLTPTMARAKPFVHIWVDERDSFFMDPFVSLYGPTWYCLGFKLHLLKYDYIETDVALERGSDLKTEGIMGRVYTGGLFDLQPFYAVNPWQAARIAADMIGNHWGSTLLYTTRHGYRSLEYIIAAGLVQSILRACAVPLEPPVDTSGFTIEHRLIGYINELVSSIINPLNTYRMRRAHLVTVYWLARMHSEAVDEPFERLLVDVWALSDKRIDYRKIAPVYI